MSSFTYLHVHTRFSHVGGPSSAEDWCRRIAALGYGTVGVADRAPLAGLPAMMDAAQRADISLIYGVELDILLPVAGARKATALRQTVVLFARDSVGTRNLARIASVAFAGWPATENPVAWEIIAAHAEGLLLILPGGDEAGALSPFVSARKSHAEWGSLLKASFKSATFVGVPHSGQPGDNALAAEVVSAALGMGLPPVALPTARYLHAADAPAYEALRVARKHAGWPREDGRSTSTSTATDRPGSFYLRTGEQAAELFQAWPEAIENTGLVASLCEYVPRGITTSAGDSAAIRELATRRLLPLLEVEALPNEAAKRLEAELHAVETLGTAGAWLVLASIAEITVTPGSGTRIPLGAPLGTADGSLLAYALGLSGVNPLGYAIPSWLAGETTPGELPPPGIEVPATERDNLLLSLASECGAERVAHAACSIEITAVQALHAAGSVLGLSGEIIKPLVAEAISKGWDALVDNEEQTVSGALVRIARALRTAPLFFKSDPDTVITAPRAVYGTSTLVEWAPVLAQGGSGASGWVPWPEESLVAMSYPVISLRPSEALSELDEARRLAARYPSPGFHAAEVDLRSYPEIGEEVTALFKHAEMAGVPYISQAALKGWKGDVTPDSVAALTARSAAAKAGYTPTAPAQPVAVWSDETAETGGMLLYREQFAAIAEAAAGVPPGDLPALGAALLNSMEAKETRAHFVAGCIVKDLSGVEADALWEELATAMPGLISRSSAAARARVAIWAAYFKIAHPAALLAAALQVAWRGGARGQISTLAREAKRLGVNILPPDVNHSEAGLSLERADSGWAILWGLSLLPGWSAEVAARLVATRPREGFTGIRDFLLAAAQVGLSPRQLEMLARAGALDKLLGKGQTRRALAEALPTLSMWALKRSKAAVSGQVDLFSSGSAANDKIEEPEWEGLLAGVPLTPRARHSLRSWEEENLGLSFTAAVEIDALARAIEKSGDLKDRLLTSDQIAADHVGQSIYVLGILCRIELLHAPDGKGEPMAAAVIEDLNGTIELVAFPPNYKRHQELWVENRLVIVTGRVSLHADGELYLLCEHMAAYSGDAEEAFTVTVTVAKPRGGSPQATPAEVAPEAVTMKAAPVAPRAASAAKRDPLPTPSSPAPASSPTYRLIITLPSSSDDHADIDRMIALNKVLTAHPGPDAVILRIPYSPETGSITSAQLPRGVSYNTLLEGEIRGLLGPDALAIIKLIG